MEESVRKMSRSLASFINSLESTTQAFKESLDRRPIPLDSASSTFMQSVNRRVSSLTADLNLLETMSFGTVSFEELLGHCNQLYHHNHSHLLHLHDLLQSSGHIPSSDGVDDLNEDFVSQKHNSPEPEETQTEMLSSYHPSKMHGLEDDPLFEEEPPSLRNLGLSDICLAALTPIGDSKTDLSDTSPRLRNSEFQLESVPHIQNAGGTHDEKICQASKQIIVSDDDYASLPSYMKSLAPWKDLQSAIEKMNSFLSNIGTSTNSDFFHPEELESMGLGSKGRSFILLLVRLNRLVVETSDGLITYRVL